ncbi:MAG TPA: hypothetical protein VHC69_17930 [Polyangiaceae bacterium]|nr:hypothetical protein [Polyangiaceae bacterium]
MSSKFAQRLVAFASVGATLVLSSSAHAQSSNQAAAEALFRDGRRLIDQQKYREACEKFAASQRLDPAVGTLLNLGKCYEKTGQTASAWATYREAVAIAKQSGQAQREKSARHAAEALEPTLSHLTIVVSPAASSANVEVSRDGVSIPHDIWGDSVPVDPGDHVITATANGYKSWSEHVTVGTSASESVTVPALEAVPSESSAKPSAPAVAPAPRDGSPTADRPPAERASFWNTQRVSAVVAGGVGVAGAAVAVVEFLQFNDKKNQEQATCPDGCKQPEFGTAKTLHDEAATARTIGIVASAVGGAALVAGTVLWFTAPTPSGDSSTVTVGTSVAPGGFMFAVHGSM